MEKSAFDGIIMIMLLGLFTAEPVGFFFPNNFFFGVMELFDRLSSDLMQTLGFFFPPSNPARIYGYPL